MFKKILIANRGEIACRVAATARRMGIRTVAVYSEADANAKHVRACDEAVAISATPGGNAPRDSYLRVEAILAAARATGAEAIHPGYGFLSENEDFARACAGAGLVFIGPPPSAIQAMGLKAEAKRLMEQAGVPLVPGYHGAEQSPELLRREAESIGYPVLIKASAGGGGKGMRVVERAQDFDAALEACRREAARSFGDDAVLIEKYLRRPRHIEIQVFTDTQGQGVYLFERDCSVQRRHQKVLEEAPAPGLSDTLRRQMGRAALSAAQAVGYVGAGTVEFIVEQTGDDETPGQTAPVSGAGAGHTALKFYFMEMNTRLQVEHPVTEAITGLDLVEWQLRVAAGQSLPLTQEQLRITGHAIEARLCAENPDTGFLPATGRLAVYRKPPAACFTRADVGTGFVRVDDGVEEGDEITPWYDPMIGKLIVHGATREEALARLDAALARVRIVGVANNVQFLRHVLATPSFARARLDTGLIERESARLFGREPLSLPLQVAAVVARVLADEADQVVGAHLGTPFSPYARPDGWRAWGQATRRFDFVVHEQLVHALLRYGPAEQRYLTVRWGGELAEGPLSFLPLPEGWLDLGWAGKRHGVAVHRQQAHWHVFTAEGAGSIAQCDTLSDAQVTHEVTGRLVAPMPGKVLSFAVRPGETVRKGQVLAVMEAMKMEHAITAPTDGTVEALLYAPGDQVAEGVELLRLSSAVSQQESVLPGH
ncbi:3-methylcrotonyl-CoA carboxylase [Hylemonella gracilis str. Niagara R]|uniref:3-methylcrotonyl-CoA carboxylase n=1 Tax=Hylemonella gracilis str. Niagara R TaxID=1458275 RepID=A0A016XEC5_9BURK|nr:acetyl/propionyl/methylcrotonyl-CoA carboxylase subunit alpha [Hylemonella gracilis]EYC50176.1 3-methylcrotonyl-CoA carboxylase [Hylemonella gracilis str. Niagara R]